MGMEGPVFCFVFAFFCRDALWELHFVNSLFVFDFVIFFDLRLIFLRVHR